MISSDSDLDQYGKAIADAQASRPSSLLNTRSFLNLFLLYELTL